jgi:hypothetical protein
MGIDIYVYVNGYEFKAGLPSSDAAIEFITVIFHIAILYRTIGVETTSTTEYIKTECGEGYFTSDFVKSAWRIVICHIRMSTHRSGRDPR